jgi:hypothetical protein
LPGSLEYQHAQDNLVSKLSHDRETPTLQHSVIMLASITKVLKNEDCIVKDRLQRAGWKPKPMDVGLTEKDHLCKRFQMQQTTGSNGNTFNTARTELENHWLPKKKLIQTMTLS